MQRTDLNPIEEATGYSELIVRFGYTQKQVAEVIGKKSQPIDEARGRYNL